MKRYEPNILHYLAGTMRKDKNGDYVKYEDMVRVMDKLAHLTIKDVELRKAFVIEFIEKM